MKKGVVAAGNRLTAEAAAEILRDGGNAFDAAIAGLFMSFVTEPVLSSPGGGGFLLAKCPDRAPELIDFFAQTPHRKRPESELDFHPTTASFSATEQEFHIGRGSVAVPGMIAGLFDMHAQYATRPIMKLAEQAIHLARIGHALDALQAEIFNVVEPILMLTSDSRSLFSSREDPSRIAAAAETIMQSSLADFLESLCREGAEIFYRGEIANRIAEVCREGGLVEKTDLERYRVVHRQPFTVELSQGRICTNPPPSSGGTLIALSVKAMQRACSGKARACDLDWYRTLIATMNRINLVRHASGFAAAPSLTLADALVSEHAVQDLVRDIDGLAFKPGGTTHLSIADAKGNMASVTVSNGEGCGHMVPGAGFMLNNMLGEEDINPLGFFRWKPDSRITSMMAPGYLQLDDGRELVLGSGGSNRIRTAIMQVLCNYLMLEMPVEQAVAAPRVHFEAGLLNLEGHLQDRFATELCREFTEHKRWSGQDFFFGGVHVAETDGINLAGAADSRRGGCVFCV